MSPNPPRLIFGDRTNTNAGLSTPPKSPRSPKKRSVGSSPLKPSSPRKRARVDLTKDVESEEVLRSSSSYRQMCDMASGRRRRVAGISNTTPILSSFVSSKTTDSYICPSLDESRIHDVPLSCAFTHTSKRGTGKPILAVGGHSGAVHLFDTLERNNGTPPAYVSLPIHDQLVFDIQWRMDDELLATACGDRTARITSLTAQKTIATLSGHSSSLKVISWDPSHRDLLCTAGRDGLLAAWDLRVPATLEDGCSILKPILSIAGAHEVAVPTAKKRKSLTAAKTVTSILYLPNTSHRIVTSGSYDGILREWDVRQPAKASSRITHVDASIDPTVSCGRRARGIASLALTSNRIWGLSMDTRIYTYSPILHETTHTQSTPLPEGFATSFFVRLAASPDERWLASGSNGGSVFLFDINSPRTGQQKPIVLNASEKEIGGLDWSASTLATCSDDGTVRIWHPNMERHRQCAESPEENKWWWDWADRGN